MLEILQVISSVFSISTGAFAVLTIISKGFRGWILHRKDRDETDRCVLRTLIKDAYYKNRDERTIDQIEYENLEKLYKQYKKLGGNSFVDKIWKDIQKWTIEP